MANTTDKTLTSWRRFFRRSNVHIAEYILMLVMMGSLAALLSSMLYSFFNLLQADEFVSRSLSLVAVGQLGALTVLAPAAFWFYSRVSGQEMVQPELTQKASRTVFLSIWLIGMFSSIVGVSISVMAGIIGAIIGAGAGVSSVLVGVVIPGVFVILLLAATIIVVAHRATRKLSIVASIAMAVLAVVLFVGTMVVAIVKNTNDSNNSSNECTYSMYRDGECSYSEYRDNRDSGRYDYSGSRSSTGGFENIYQPSTRY